MEWEELYFGYKERDGLRSEDVVGVVLTADTMKYVEKMENFNVKKYENIIICCGLTKNNYNRSHFN